MRRIATLAALLLVPALAMVSGDAIARARTESDPSGWHMTGDALSGPVVRWSDDDGRDLARLECVGPSAAMPLLYADRPYNLVLSLETRLAPSWIQGREVFALVRGPDGWSRAAVLAVGARLIIDPRETDRALTAAVASDRIEVRLVGNTRSGIIQEPIALPRADLPVWRQEQLAGCARIYG